MTDSPATPPLEAKPPKLTLKQRLHHMRRLVEDQEERIKGLEKEVNSLTWRNQSLRDELSRAGTPVMRQDVDKFTAPVPRLADEVKDIDRARGLLAEVNEHIGQALQERDALLEYILVKSPEAPERHERERVTQSGDTGWSVIRRLRIGKREEKEQFCSKCGQPSAKHCSAHLFLGFYPDGRLGEMFVTLGRSHRNVLAGGGFHLAAKLGSLALQYGAKPESIVRQMRYQKDSSAGRPFGPDGPLKDTPGVSSLVDYIGVTIERVLAEKVAERAEIEKVEPVVAEQPIAAASPENPDASVEKK
jgi:hypothetical protein